MKKILVPTDFSQNAMNAFLFANELACSLDCSLTLLHTFQAPQRSDMLVSLDKVLQRDAEREIAALLEKLSLKKPPEVKIIKGDAVRTIADLAEEGGFSLIVMGTKGASGLKEVFLGSITGGVMRHTNIPILAVPEDYAPRPIKNIAFAMSNIRLSGEAVIAPLKELTRRFDAKVHIFHSVTDKETADKTELLETVEWLEGLPYDLSMEEERGSLEESIKAFVKSVDADMLCLVRRKHGHIGFFERLFKTSATLNQVFHCELPLLVLHSE